MEQIWQEYEIGNNQENNKQTNKTCFRDVAYFDDSFRESCNTKKEPTQQACYLKPQLNSSINFDQLLIFIQYLFGYIFLPI